MSARHRQGPDRPARWLVIAVLVLSGAAAALATVAQRLPAAPRAGGWHVLAVLVLLAASASIGLEYRRRGHGDRVDLFEVALAVALVALPAGAVVGLVVLTKAVTLTVQRVPIGKTVFNVAQRACAAAAGALLFALLRQPGPSTGRDLLVLVPALLLVTVVNAAAVAGALGAAGSPPTRTTVAAGLVNLLVNVSAGVLAAALWQHDWQVWPVLGLLLVAAATVPRRWAERDAAATALLGLQRATAVLAGSDRLADSAESFLAELRLGFACAGAELHLLTDDGATRSPLLAALLEQAPVRLPDAGHPGLAPLLAQAGWRDALAVPVRCGDEVAGLLLTHDRDGWSGLETRELGVLESVASVVGEALRRERLATALAAARQRWQAMVQHASDVVVLLDGDDRVTYGNDVTPAVLGALSGSLVDRVDAADRPALAAALREVRGGRSPVGSRLEFQVGGTRLEAVVTRLGDDLLLNARDVTARYRAERSSAEQARLLELVTRGAALPKTLGDLVAGVEQQSPGSRCAVLTGRAAEPHLLGHRSLPAAAEQALRDQARGALGSAGDADTVVVPAGEALRAIGLAALHVRSFLPTGTRTWGAFVYGTPVGVVPTAPDPVTADLVATATRVAALAVQHARVQGRLAHRAAHDALTELPNRTLFLDRLTRALRSSGREGRSVLVLFLDLDRFKVVNDSLGHRAGDALLRMVAERLGQAVRPGDTVARFGGDEFTMLCEDIVDEAHGLRLVERVRACLARPFAVGAGGVEVYATASIGLALGSGTELPPEVLVENADAAMYRAKERGGNRFEVFDAQLRDRALHRLDLSSALHRGLEREEFRVVYQPAVSLRSGALVGAEALVRWDRPDRGLVLPDDFIGPAEENGLIVPIGRAVMQSAFEQAARWQDEAATARLAAPSVSVNLSPRQLVDPGLPALVRDALARTSVDPALITLEITETALMHDIESSGASLLELKGLGVQLHVDDFGTGYSSLTYLQRLPVDGVKVDRSFVAGLGTRPDAGAIVRAVVGLAHSLGLVAVAEGVETAGQARQLRDLECESAQGWYFGRPVPPDEIRLDERLVRPQ